MNRQRYDSVFKLRLKVEENYNNKLMMITTIPSPILIIHNTNIEHTVIEFAINH